MLNVQGRCEGAFIGHAIASDYDSSISMAINISDSLLEYQNFNGPDILSRYLYSYHKQHSEVGETMKYLYKITLDKIQHTNPHSPISREDFKLDQSSIDEYVKMTNAKLNGYTAGCGPAQRSFPLAFYCKFDDDDDDVELFNLSREEAALTHYNPLAEQVSGVVNVICRSLLKKRTFVEAVRNGSSTPSLHSDILNACQRYARSPDPVIKTHVAYAPTALNTALYCIQNSTNAKDAINIARTKDKFFCAPIVGILAGALWGIPKEMYKNRINDPQFSIIRTTAGKLSNSWPTKHDTITN